FWRFDRSGRDSLTSRSSSVMITWHRRFLIIVGRRWDDARHRLMMGPGSTRASTRWSLFTSTSRSLVLMMSVALPNALSSSFLQNIAPRFEHERRMAIALL